MTAFPFTWLEFLTSTWLVQCQEEQAQPTELLGAQAPRIQFWLRNHEHSAQSFLVLPKPGFAQSLCSNIFPPWQDQGTWIFLQLGDKEVPEHFVQVPMYHRLLNATLEQTWLLSGLSMSCSSHLKAPRDAEAILLEFALPIYLPSAKDILPVSYLHLSAFVSQPLALVPAFSDRLKSSLETGVFFCWRHLGTVIKSPLDLLSDKLNRLFQGLVEIFSVALRLFASSLLQHLACMQHSRPPPRMGRWNMFFLKKWEKLWRSWGFGLWSDFSSRASSCPQLTWYPWRASPLSIHGQIPLS